MAVDPAIALMCLGLPVIGAFATLQAYEWPRIAEKQHNARLRAAAKKAQVETAGLRNTVEGIELRLRDTRAAIAGIDENLRYKLQKMPARDQAALDGLIGQGTFGDLLTVLRKSVLIDRRVDSLARSWMRGASERQCTQALCENLWILEPDLVSDGHMFLGKPLGAVAEAYFGASSPRDDLSKAAAKKKPSAIGVFRRRSMVAHPDDPGVTTLVIVEARQPGETIGEAVVGAGISYANTIRRLAPVLQTWPVECLIVAGAVSTDAHVAMSNAPPGTHVHLTTWDALTELARTRRPETIDLNPVRFDTDQAPSYRNMSRNHERLGDALGIGDGAETGQDQDRA